MCLYISAYLTEDLNFVEGPMNAGCPNRLRFCGLSYSNCSSSGVLVEEERARVCALLAVLSDDICPGGIYAGREEMGKYRPRDSSQYIPGRSRGILLGQKYVSNVSYYRVCSRHTLFT